MAPVALAVGSIAVANLVGPRRPNPTKLGAYESGSEPIEYVARTGVSIKIFMFAMLFDVEDDLSTRGPSCGESSAGPDSGRWSCSSASSLTELGVKGGWSEDDQRGSSR